MKAISFIKTFGIKQAKKCLENCASPNDKWFLHMGVLVCDSDFDDLKRIVESYELLSTYSDIDTAKFFSKNQPDNIKLRQAIKDVESCKA